MFIGQAVGLSGFVERFFVDRVVARESRFRWHTGPLSVAPPRRQVVKPGLYRHRKTCCGREPSMRLPEWSLWHTAEQSRRSLQDPAEALEMSTGMLPLAIRRVGKPYRRRRRVTGRSVVTHVCPQASRFGFAVARRESANRRAVGMDFMAAHDVTLKGVDQWSMAKLPTATRTLRLGLMDVYFAWQVFR